jgi:hypothetical protein
MRRGLAWFVVGLLAGAVFPACVIGQVHESRLHRITLAPGEPGRIVFVLERVDDGEPYAVLPGSFSVALCDPEGDDQDKWPSEEQILWAIGGMFDDLRASDVRSIHYAVVPSGWKEQIAAQRLPVETCLRATAFTRWGPYHAVVGFKVREDGTIQTLWRLPPVDRRT